MSFETEEKISKKYNITLFEAIEVSYYIRIFEDNFFENHHEVNQYITKDRDWEDFKNIRSYNNHGIHKNIRGIQPKFFYIVCRELGLKDFKGEPLDSYRPY